MTRGRVYEGITMTDKMTVAIAAGGTAGHINPALALAEELRDRGHHVVFVGQSRKLEGRLVPEAGFDFVPITVTGFDRSRPWTALTSLWRVNKAKRALARHFSKVGKPDAAIGFGAYVEVPLLGWCKDAGVPYLLHEQNSVPGLANKMMNSHAARVCISVPAARAVFEREGDPDHVLMPGNPVRRSVIEGARARGRKTLGVPEDATLLLVFGGSLGAQHLNERVASLKSEQLPRETLYILHSAICWLRPIWCARVPVPRAWPRSPRLPCPRYSCRIRTPRPTTRPRMRATWSMPAPACFAPMPISMPLPLPTSCCT